MNTSKRLFSRRLFTAGVGVLTLSHVPGAFAYLDPGTGSFVLQMIIAGALGAMFYIKTAWAGTKAYLSRLFGGSTQEEVQQEVENVLDSSSQPSEASPATKTE